MRLLGRFHLSHARDRRRRFDGAHQSWWNAAELSVSDDYAHVASVEAKGQSPLYEALAASISKDPAVLDLIGSLPEARRQPNLFPNSESGPKRMPGRVAACMFRYWRRSDRSTSGTSLRSAASVSTSRAW